MLYRLSLLVLILVFSCNQKALPEAFSLNKERGFYLGTIEVSIFKINHKVELKEIKNYPVANSDFKAKNWNLIKPNLKIYGFLKDYLNDSFNTTVNKTDVQFIKELIVDLEKDNTAYLISGLYDVKIGLEDSKNENYYCIYLIDREKNIFYEFNLSHYW